MENLNILVICTGNSCRSQIAEGYLKYFIKKLNLDANVFSAGVKAEGINKDAIEVMAEDNIDISFQTSNTIEEYFNQEISHVITVCDHANESCPIYLKKSNLTHQNFFDPSKVVGNEKERKITFEKCRDEIKVFSLNYLNKILARN